jgi:hypothetical protein
MRARVRGLGAALGGGFGRDGLLALLGSGEPPPGLVGRPRGERYSARYDRFQSMDTYSRLAFVAADHALDEAGLLSQPTARADMGVILGSRFGCHEANARFDEFRVEPDGVRNASPLRFKGTMDNAPAGWISVAWGLGGPNLTLVSGRGAGAEAFAVALEELRSGSCTQLLVGAVERSTELLRSAAGRGLEQAEGAAVLVLEATFVPSAGPRGTSVVDVALAGQSGVEALLEAHGLRPTDLGLWLADPSASHQPAVLDGVPVRNLAARCGDLHAAWSAVAVALLAVDVERWSSRGAFAMVQVATEEPGRDHWILVRGMAP